MKIVKSATEITDVFTGETKLKDSIEYDKNGNIVHIVSDGIEIKNTYDKYGNLIKIEQSNGYWAEFRYHRNGYLAFYKNSDGYAEAYLPDGKRAWANEKGRNTDEKNRELYNRNGIK